MQKIGLIAALLLVLGFSAHSQSKLGLKFSPVISSNRVDIDFEDVANDTLDIENDGSRFKFSLGLIFDYEITETYFFSTGLVFIPKSVTFSVTPDNGSTFTPVTEEYKMQYLQIPISLKLFTNEVLPDVSVYFQVGGAAEIKLHDEPLEDEFTTIEKFNPIDGSVILGTGAEYRAGVSTILFGGISYQRGLINTMNTSNPELANDFTIRNTALMIELGVKF